MELVHFAPYVPGEEEPWDPVATAAHLLRRSGFGAPQEDIDRLTALDMAARVEGLFDEAEDQEAEFQDTFQRLNGSYASFGDGQQLQVWWCYRMLRTRVPLREKLTLFWHGHFTSSISKIGSAQLMHLQCEMLRNHAWRNFRDLLLAVCRDPAMLIYLDGEANVKKHPNENFARELLELFTLGIGHYTEEDVREAARAFTGLTRSGIEFSFNEEEHDAGPKVFLGQRGPFAADDIVAILSDHPALPRFIARKLLVFFACPEPAEEVVTEAAEVFKEGNLEIKPFLATLFQSKFFYSPACRRTRIASPVELVVGTCRTLGLRFPAPRVRDHIAAIGQEFYTPPSVKGWDGERKWITSITWAARQAFAREVAGLDAGDEWSPNLDLKKLVPATVILPGMVVDKLAGHLLDGRLGQAKRLELAEFLVTQNGQKQPRVFRKDADFRKQQIRAAVEVVLSLPEYQMY